MACAFDRHHLDVVHPEREAFSGGGLAGIFGLMRHAIAGVAVWEGRANEERLAAIIERSGGKLTDSMERELLRRAMWSDWM